jgi:hypothetical protein
MVSRALSLATVTLLIGCLSAVSAQAQNLEAGKSPSQIFAQTCNACHKSPRGLLKSVSPGSLPSFLRQHYTTSSDMAGVLASYLVSNGATDARYQARGGKDGKEGGKDGAKEKDANSTAAQQPEHGRRQRQQQEATKPEAEGSAPPPEGARTGQKRMARPSEEGAKEAARPEGQAAGERAPEGRKARRLSKRGKPETEDAPKVDAATPPADDKKGELGGETKGEAKSEPKAEPEKETAKVDSGRDETKPDSGKAASEMPAGEATPESAKENAKVVEPSGNEAPALRPDPAPPVTPASPAAVKQAEPTSELKPVADVPTAKPAETATGDSAEPAAKPQPAATVAAPLSPPAEASGPPAAPISR